jgi:hypothetical protein
MQVLDPDAQMPRRAAFGHRVARRLHCRADRGGIESQTDGDVSAFRGEVDARGLHARDRRECGLRARGASPAGEICDVIAELDRFVGVGHGSCPEIRTGM